MTDIKFDPLVYGSVEEAKKARNEAYRAYKKEGKKVKCWVLRNQLKKYECFGVEDGRVRDVYFISIYD